MDLQINRQSQLPIHVQLQAQLTHMIQAGQLSPGTQLPTVRQLAGYLRINRNTAARVFADLEREGILVCQKGRGSFVAEWRAGSKAKSPRMRSLVQVVDESMERATRLGFSATEFATALYTRAQTVPAAEPTKLRALFTECNVPQLRQFSREVEQALPLRVDGLLVPELTRTFRRSPDHLRRYALVITTFWHVHEVQNLLRKASIEVVGLMADASLETLMRLTALPEGTKVGVACHEWTGSENVRLSIQNAGLTNVQLVMGCGAEPESLKRMLKEARVVVCSSLVARKVRAVASSKVDIIVDDRTLNKGGLEMLRQRLARLTAGLPAQETLRDKR
ncbi:MAG TPA: GntR family transcriptional regulator [Candidatus Acidoferrum sp.]|nr:GntR family transcriptional regulator [Candidatus Acidoferrum sp.]